MKKLWITILLVSWIFTIYQFWVEFWNIDGSLCISAIAAGLVVIVELFEDLIGE